MYFQKLLLMGCAASTQATAPPSTKSSEIAAPTAMTDIVMAPVKASASVSSVPDLNNMPPPSEALVSWVQEQQADIAPRRMTASKSGSSGNSGQSGSSVKSKGSSLAISATPDSASNAGAGSDRHSLHVYGGGGSSSRGSWASGADGQPQAPPAEVSLSAATSAICSDASVQPLALCVV